MRHEAEQRAADLEREVAELRKKLEDRDQLLRRAMVEKGENLVRQLEESRARAHQAATMRVVDPATLLLRHGYFRQRLAFEAERSAATGEPWALLLIDLDGFTAFNAARGYEEGERALAQVARSLETPWLLRPAVRPPAFGREGGDCFGAILPAADAADAQRCAEELRNLVERLPLPQPRLTASIGGASAAAGVTAANLFSAATAALKKAREGGGNRVEWVATGDAA